MDTTIKKYLVGGAVRDQLLGLKPKDMDYAVEAPSYPAMKIWLENQGARIFQEREQFGVIRAKLGKIDADFVLCRKDGPYTDSRHPDYVTTGTLLDDLARRDFTINAMALTDDGQVIDPFGGMEALDAGVIAAVGDPFDRLTEDPLRAFRAIRFAVTKTFDIDADLKRAMNTERILTTGMDSVATERIREEMFKAFHTDSFRAIKIIYTWFPRYFGIMQERGLWFKPTLEG